MSKVSWRDILGGFQWTVFKNRLTLWKKSVLHITTPMHCKVRQVLRDLLIINQGNGSEMICVAGATKVNLKILKT